jgi:hypothetical protein
MVDIEKIEVLAEMNAFHIGIIRGHNETFEKRRFFVIPAQAGIQKDLKILDSRFHGNDNFIPFTEKFNKGLTILNHSVRKSIGGTRLDHVPL